MINLLKKYKYKINKYKNSKNYTITFIFTEEDLTELGIVYNKNEGSGIVKTKTPRVTNADIMNLLVKMQADISKNTKVIKKHFPKDFK